MNRPYPALFIGTLVWMAHGLLCTAQSQPVSLTWGELGPRITGHKIALVLPEGTHVEGKVRSVEPEGVHLRVSKTSDRAVMPKGERVIPRQSVSLLRVTQYRKLGRLLVTTGAVAVASVVVATNYPDLYEGPALVAVPAVTAAGIAGIAIGGYYAGKRLDRTETDIRIVPDPPRK